MEEVSRLWLGSDRFRRVFACVQDCPCVSIKPNNCGQCGNRMKFKSELSQGIIIRSQKGRQVLWMEIGSSFERRVRNKRREGNIRYNLVMQARQKEDRDFCDGWKECLRGPDLMA